MRIFKAHPIFSLEELSPNKLSSFVLDFHYSSTSAMSTVQPYDYMESQHVNPYLCCSICKKPFVNPMTTSDGLKRGCLACFTNNPLYESTPLVPIQEMIVLEMLNSLLVRCTRCHEENIRRGDLEQHEANACKRARVSCKAADLKCTWHGVREELDAHMKECVFEPIRPALAEILAENRRLKEKLDKLENLITKLTQRHQ